jgi:2-keto-3-deoxy-6-phosphogluconate aldolase
MESYLKEPPVLALGGSWIATRRRIQNEEWLAITEDAAKACQIIAQSRAGAH